MQWILLFSNCQKSVLKRYLKKSMIHSEILIAFGCHDSLFSFNLYLLALYLFLVSHVVDIFESWRLFCILELLIISLLLYAG